MNEHTRLPTPFRSNPVAVAAAIVGLALFTWLVTVSRMRGMDAGPGTDLGALGWFVGTDPAGRRTATIEVPTLIADGSADRIDAAANDRTLAGLIRGSRLVLYPDAGHAFLFQEGTPFTALIESFLGGAQN